MCFLSYYQQGVTLIYAQKLQKVLSKVTLVTHEKLKASPKRWCPKVIKICFIEVSETELSERLADVGKILYDELSQRPKSLSPDPGMILEQRTTNE